MHRTPCKESEDSWLRLGGLGTHKCLFIPGKVLGESVQFLFDTGASCTVISHKLWTRIPAGSRPELAESQIRLATVGDHEILVWGRCPLTLELNGHQITCMVHVCEVAEEAVLGVDALRALRAQWDWDQDTLIIGQPDLKLSRLGCSGVDQDGPAELTDSSQDDNQLEKLIEPGQTAATRYQDMEVLEEPTAPTCLAGLKGYLRGPVFPKTPKIAALKGESTQVEGQQGPAEDQAGCKTQGPSTKLPDHLEQMFEASLVNLAPEQQNQLATLLHDFAHVFSRNDSDLGRTGLERHHIPTGDAIPIRLPPRRAPMHLREDIESQVQTLMAHGIVEPCSSSWAAPLVIVKKKDGSNRICVDYRALNNVTAKDGHPIPRIGDSLDALAGATVFSTLDMTSGYHQVEVAEEDRDKTAFVTGRGHHLRFVTMPFGLCGAPSTFQRLMEKVLDGLIWRTVVVYLDDVVVFSRNQEEHVENLRTVLQRFEDHKLKLKPRKCELFRSQVTFLGHVVSAAGVSTDPSLIEKVTAWEPPTNQKEVRAFLGLTGYYRAYVPDYGGIAEPLVRLTDAKASFKWTEACQSAFEHLKSCLVSAPILAYPTLEDPFILDTDASEVAIGAVLSQVQNGVERVIAYGSKTLSRAERNYCVTRRELLAVVHFTDAYRYYLYGKHFTIRTDHASLQWMLNVKEPVDQLARWIQRMQNYQYTIEHRPGRKHGNADAMSRAGKCFRGGQCFHPTCTESIDQENVRTNVGSPETLNPNKEVAGPKQVSVLRATRKGDSRREDPDADSSGEDDNNGLETGYSTEDLREEQGKDPDIRYLRDRLETCLPCPSKSELSPCSPAIKHWCARWRQLELRDGLVKFRWEPHRQGDPIEWKVLAPQGLRESIMTAVHDLKASGHLGTYKTWERAKRSPFIWAGMRSDVDRWVRRCQKCQQRKPPNARKRARMVTYQVGAPWERIAADVVGPFPRTNRGNRYILVVQDYFTKWVEVFPMHDQTAETIATLLVDQVFSRFGCCREFHSDQGTNFESLVMKEVARLFGIKKTRTTSYHPRGDGMVERFNRTLEAMLSQWTNTHQDDWDEHLSLLSMAYRSSPHETTGETPNVLNFGREVTLPVDLILEPPPDEDHEDSPSEYVARLKDRLRTAHEAARAHSTTAMVTQKCQYDHNVRLVTYQEGDVVWLHCPIRRVGKSFKITRPWTGPYVIVKSISEVTSRIQKSPRGKAQIVHADRLKPCVGLSARDLGFPDLVGDTEPPERSTPNQGSSGQDTSLALIEGSSEETRDSLDPVEYTGSPESEDNPPQDPPKVTTDKRKGGTPAQTGSDWDYLPRSRRGRPVRKPVRYGYED